MATNYVQPGDVVEIEKADVSSGDHVVLGNLNGVALTDADDDDKVQLATKGVFDLEVAGEDGDGDKEISAGDKVYDDSGDLNVDSANGTLFGIALDGVASGESSTIPVMIVNPV